MKRHPVSVRSDLYARLSAIAALNRRRASRELDALIEWYCDACERDASPPVYVVALDIGTGVAESLSVRYAAARRRLPA